MTSRKIVIKDLIINYYEQSGNAGNPVLVFLHGWRSQGQVWQGVIEKFSEYPCLVLDLPGFGKSEMQAMAMDVSDYASIVKVFLEKLSIARAIFIGHSFGGRIAIKLCVEYPEIVEKVVLVDSAGLRRKSRKNDFVKVTSKVLKPFLPQVIKNKLYKVWGSDDYIATPELRQTFINVINEDLTDYLPQIEKPVLLIWGENDLETPLDHGMIMNRLIRNSQLVVLKDAGHYSFLDKADAFTESLTSFILASQIF